MFLESRALNPPSARPCEPSTEVSDVLNPPLAFYDAAFNPPSACPLPFFDRKTWTALPPAGPRS